MKRGFFNQKLGKRNGRRANCSNSKRNLGHPRPACAHRIHCMETTAQERGDALANTLRNVIIGRAIRPAPRGKSA